MQPLQESKGTEEQNGIHLRDLCHHDGWCLFIETVSASHLLAFAKFAFTLYVQ
jgi:hypothetical protein